MGNRFRDDFLPVVSGTLPKMSSIPDPEQMQTLIGIVREMVQRTSVPPPLVMHFLGSGSPPRPCPQFRAYDQVTRDREQVTCPLCLSAQVMALGHYGPAPACSAQPYDWLTQRAADVTCPRCRAWLQAQSPPPPRAPAPVVRPQEIVYCSAAPPRAVVERVRVKLDGPDAVTVPLVFSARMKVEWERHEAWRRASGSSTQFDHDARLPVGPDQFGGLVRMLDDLRGIRCRLCGGWERVVVLPAREE
jgi:hypothetical protein